MPMLEQTVEQLASKVNNRFYGKYRGVVTNNNDDDGLGRIMAQVPAVMGETEIGWALPAFAFVGDGHGCFMLPEVGSMVWIEFEAGNPDFPIWSGGFLAQNQSRPEPGDVSVRVIVSKNQHKIVLDDQSDKIIVEHAGGAKIELSNSEISLTLLASKMVMTGTSITFNDGVLRIGPAGVSLAQGAITLGVPPT
jgi:uncharacterized protein involved in type VI secretion and phage assembly